jgi:hypothetical protein
MRRVRARQVGGHSRRHWFGQATELAGRSGRSGQNGSGCRGSGYNGVRVLGRWVGVASAFLVAALALTHTAPVASSSAATTVQNGAAGEGCAAIKLADAQWWYNWYVDSGCDAPDYVPMISGQDKKAAGDVQWEVDRAYSNGYRTLLGFNEPNRPDQASMSVQQALDLWPILTSRSDVVVGSPVVSSDSSGTQWLTSFMQGVADKNLRVDFMTVHFYGWNAGSCTGANLESYLKQIQSVADGRPIWVTEFGCLSTSNTDEQTVRQFYDDAVKVMKQLGIERWCWYAAEKNHALVDNGKLTSLGQDFAAESQQ